MEQKMGFLGWLLYVYVMQAQLKMFVLVLAS